MKNFGFRSSDKVNFDLVITNNEKYFFSSSYEGEVIEKKLLKNLSLTPARGILFEEDDKIKHKVLIDIAGQRKVLIGTFKILDVNLGLEEPKSRENSIDLIVNYRIIFEVIHYEEL